MEENSCTLPEIVANVRSDKTSARHMMDVFPAMGASIVGIGVNIGSPSSFSTDACQKDVCLPSSFPYQHLMKRMLRDAARLAESSAWTFPLEERLNRSPLIGIAAPCFPAVYRKRRTGTLGCSVAMVNWIIVDAGQRSMDSVPPCWALFLCAWNTSRILIFSTRSFLISRASEHRLLLKLAYASALQPSFLSPLLLLLRYRLFGRVEGSVLCEGLGGGTREQASWFNGADPANSGQKNTFCSLAC